jgi:uncharacterized protein (UPF0332 family)
MGKPQNETYTPLSEYRKGFDLFMNDLIRYRLDRAHESLAEAEIMAEQKHFNTCINRLYYACFYSVIALLETKGLSSAKHSGVRSLFNKNFVMTEIIGKDLAAVFNDLFEYRQESDYEDFFVMDEETARSLIEPAKRLIAIIEDNIQ